MTITNISLSNSVELLNLYFNIKCIILFGNTSVSSKDIDLLIISENFSSIFIFKRAALVRSILSTAKKIDPICLTPTELADYIEKQNPFYLNILKKGTLIYGNKIS
ncbi:hypothetical protein DS742_12765 [Lacrimispora amygdalina]|uniref:Nucleotidyltransferase domain-containing protein n=1 Tax=Lacrimispora amygdalina TaxID=253257 RepID=A0A3E2NCC8_9FIRM|nr:hypothetical protein DS742_12765 [Clostridium indicum]